MPRSLRRVLPSRLIALAVGVVGALAIAPSAASAATLEYSCKYPVVGTLPFSVEIATSAPAAAAPFAHLEPFTVSVKATAKSGQPLALQGATRVLGAAKLKVAFNGGIWAGPPIDLPLTAQTSSTGDPSVIIASGQTPPLDLFNEYITMKALGLSFNLKAVDGSGVPVILPKSSTDVEGNPTVDSDDDPATFAVSCKLDPPTQNIDLARISIVFPDNYGYAVSGEAKVPTLISGAARLGGTFDATFAPPSGLVTGNLQLPPQQARLLALGAIPVTAKLAFVSSGEASGTIGGTVPGLTLNQKVRIKVLEARLFGAIPLVGGNGCQAKSLTDLTLTGPFTPEAGGKVDATFKVSDLNGCGSLNGLVNPIVASDGNTIALTLTPRA